MDTFFIQYGEKTLSLPALPHLTVAQAIFTSGKIPAPPLCSGLGKCGKCRIRFIDSPPSPCEKDTQLFTQQQLDEGWRLGCHHYALPKTYVEVPYLAPAPLQCVPKKSPTLLAVDLGTTSIHWQALAPDPTHSGKYLPVASGQEINPQMGAGSEVMSRLAFARSPEGQRTMQCLVIETLQRILATIQGTQSIEKICVAGNTVMTYLLLGLPIDGLATAPYHVQYPGGTTRQIPNLPPVYIPPLPSPFVGGDLSAGMMELLAQKPAYPFLLADLGTNGECVLALSPENYFVTSVALGPALEGIGLTFGSLAQDNVITKFTLTPAGLLPHTAGNGPARGISGTGYISLLHQLRKTEILQEDGHFASPPRYPLAKRLAKNIYYVQKELRFRLPDNHYLSAHDVEELLKVKAAFTVALERLLLEADLLPSQLQAIYLAGALGTHAPVEHLEGLGFIPQGMAAQVHPIGNIALQGAARFLIDQSTHSMAERWTTKVQTVDLTTDPAFTKTFMRHMHFIF